MAGNAFWTDATLQDPKRKFRFTVSLLAYPGGAKWYAKSVTKPQITISETSHVFLNHTFYYPGKVEWNAIDVTLVDPVGPDAVANTMGIIMNAGYAPPTGPDSLTTMSKARAVGALKGVVIDQIDSEGKSLEQWKLNNAFITSVNLGDLAYDAEELSEIALTIRYDWATCIVNSEGYNGDNSGLPAGITAPIGSKAKEFFSTTKSN
jgi:hypothetical protein